ncbi:MAG: hypothetical protein DIU80_017370 [Chloroflexota bacterium]
MAPRLIITTGEMDGEAWDAPLPRELLALLRSEAARLDASVAKALGPTEEGLPRVSPAVLAVELIRAAITHQVRFDETGASGQDGE